MKKYGIFEPGNASQGKNSFDQYLNNHSFQQSKQHFGTFSVRKNRMSQSDKHFYPNQEENSTTKFVCKNDKCGRQFDSEARLRDHQLRIHEKAINQSNSSNFSQNISTSSIKLPQIQTQNTPSSQPTKTRNANSDDLHPIIRQAQQIASNIASSSSGLSSTKKLTSSSTTKISSRPSSSSSSTFNTTSSSTNNIDFANIKNSFLSSPAKNLMAPKKMEAISHISSHEKEVSEVKFLKNPTSEQLSSNKQVNLSSSLSSSSFSSTSARTKEEILFGKKQISNTIKQSGNNSQIKLPIENQKLDNIKEKLISKECQQKGSSDEAESDKDEELDKEDQILQINFSEDEENDNEEEDLTEPKEKGKVELISKNQQEEEILERTKNEELTKKILNQQFILEYTGCSALNEITELILRNKNLLFLDDTDQLDWSEMSQLSFLSICHNPRMSSIQALYSIPNMCLLEISLEYNAISNITAILRHNQVQKLFLSGNLIESISGIESLPQIKTLSLMKNKIKGLTSTIESLSSLPLLEELDLEQNPVSSRFNYKYDILWKLKLKKLDGDMVTDIDLELSKTFQSEYLQFCRENQQNMGNSQKITRPSTAKPSTIAPLNNNNNTSQQSYKGRFKAKLGELVEQSKVVLGSIPEEKQWELETEIELAKQQERELQQELMVLQLEGNENKSKCDKLISQNFEFQSSLSEYKDALKQQTQLQSKYKQYVQLLNSNSSEAAKYIKAIFKLNLRLEELNNEQSCIQKEQQESIDNKPNSDENYFGIPAFSKIKQDKQANTTQFENHSLFNNHNKRVMMYDDAEELKEDDDVELPSVNMDSQKQKGKLASDSKVQGDIQDDSSNEESNEDCINLDIGFDSDDLDEETKEIKELLQKNSKALEDVKRELNGI